MELSFLLSMSVVVFFVLLSIVVSRSYIVFLVILLGSEVFGLLDPRLYAIKGVFDIHAWLALIIAITVIFSVRQIKDLRHAVFLKPFLILALLWGFGIISPILKGHSSIFFAVENSKEFLMIFFYFAIFLFIRTKQEIKWSWYFLIGLGVYYSVLEIAAQLFGINLISHLSYYYRREIFVFWKIYPPFWPFILIALFHSYFELVLGVKRCYSRIFLASIGLILTFFRSYLLGTMVSVPIVLLLSKKGKVRAVSQGLGLVTAGVLVFFLATLVLGDGLNMFNKISNEFVFSGIKEFSSQTGGSLAGRKVLAQEREEILQKSPYIGYGFLDKDSEYGKVLKRHITGKMLGFVDKGNLDIALKFGYIGSVVLYGAILFIIIKLIKMARRRLSPPILCVRSLAILTMLMVGIVVLPVHATLTHSFFLLPLSIAIGLIEKENFLLANEAGIKA